MSFASDFEELWIGRTSSCRPPPCGCCPTMASRSRRYPCSAAPGNGKSVLERTVTFEIVAATRRTQSQVAKPTGAVATRATSTRRRSAGSRSAGTPSTATMSVTALRSSWSDRRRTGPGVAPLRHRLARPRLTLFAPLPAWRSRVLDELGEKFRASLSPSSSAGRNIEIVVAPRLDQRGQRPSSGRRLHAQRFSGAAPAQGRLAQTGRRRAGTSSARGPMIRIQPSPNSRSGPVAVVAACREPHGEGSCTGLGHSGCRQPDPPERAARGHRLGEQAPPLSEVDPTAAYSSRCQPVPAPRSIRPSES